MSVNRAFSLLEVVIAVAIFAGAVTIILALLGPLNRSIGDVADQGKAARLGDAITVEIVRIRGLYPATAGGRLDAMSAALFSNADSILQLVATRDGTRVVRLTPNADGSSDADRDPAAAALPGIAPVDRFYLIEMRPLGAPLEFVAGESAFLALSAHVFWPFQEATGEDTVAVSPSAQRQSLVLNFALPP